jgi:P4 family phage/plasmid primase-like protien
MVFDNRQLRAYAKLSPEFVPVHPWNKSINGKPAGKMPADADWQNKRYAPDAYKGWVSKGYNLGYRVKDDEIVIDLDPRNYAGIDVEQLIAEAFGFFDFEELEWELPVVRTGGGGYHIYCTLPDWELISGLRETIPELPGAEFKKKGRQVLAAGSKHPNGNFYKWLNDSPRVPLPEELLRKLEFTKPAKTGANQGVLTGEQLRELVLDKLNPCLYDTNDTWFPVLCGAHHATDGAGSDVFVEWCLRDEFFVDDENSIRARWDSLSGKENSITVGTLINELKKSGEDTRSVKAVLQFNEAGTFDDSSEDESEEGDGGDDAIIKNAKKVASSIDLGDFFDEPGEDFSNGVDGKAVEFAKNLNADCSEDDLIKCLRLIKAASIIEAGRAEDILVAKKLVSRSKLSKLLAKLDAQINTDLARVIADKALSEIFNNKKHITYTPGGIWYMYSKTHWAPISEAFLGRMTLSLIDELKKKIDIKVKEATLVSEVVKLIQLQIATKTDLLHSPKDLPASVINCKNGELWMNNDGSHKLKPHKFNSYQLNCLGVNYSPDAECPLFMQTLKEIFRDFSDTDDIIRHIGEIMGYIAQPKKNIAAWWLLKGPGGDGKSTLLKILGGILEDSQMMGTASMLDIGSSIGDSHLSHSFIGKLNIVIEELPARFTLNDAGLKMMSENTKMTANPKGRDRFPFQYCGSLVMCANRYPASRDFTHAMMRRANVIPFSRQFTNSGEQDLDRAEKILNSPTEMAGILNFMLEGLQRLRQRGGFLVPETCEKAKLEWIGCANNVVKFTQDVIFRGDAEQFIGTLGDLHGIHYQLWCQENDIEEKLRLGKKNFSLALQELGFVVKKAGKNITKVFGGELFEDD